MKRASVVLIPLILATMAVVLGATALPKAVQKPPTATPSATATATPTATITPTPTVTTTPTPTVTPTPTPVVLPVGNGTAIPDLPYEVITAENVSRLREIARYGYPRLLDVYYENPYRLTADGKTIVVGTTAGIEFYDAATQERIGGFAVPMLRRFDITPDGRFVLTQAGKTLTVWRQDGQKVQEFDLEVGDTWELQSTIAISPDGALVAAQRVKTDWEAPDLLDVYRVEDGARLDTFRGMGAMFTPDGKYLASVFDGRVQLYPVAELGEGWERRLPKQNLPWADYCDLAFSPDGTLAAVARAERVDVYNVAERRLVRQISGWKERKRWPPAVQFTPQSDRVLIVTQPLYDGLGNVRVKAQAILVDIASGEWVSHGDAPQGFVYADGQAVRSFLWQAEGEIGELISVSNDGRVFSRPLECVSADEKHNCYTLRHTDKWQLLKNGEVVVEFQVPAGYTVGHWWLDNGVSVGNDYAAISWHRGPFYGFAVFDLKSGKKVFFAPSGKAVDRSANHELFSIGYYENGDYYVLLVGDGRVRKLPYPACYYHTLDQDSPRLFLFCDDEYHDDKSLVLAVNLENMRKTRLTMPQTYADCILASSTANLLVFPDLRFWNLANFLEGDIEPVFSTDIGTWTTRFAFSDDRRFFATQGEDGFIRVWAVLAEQ